VITAKQTIWNLETKGFEYSKSIEAKMMVAKHGKEAHSCGDDPRSKRALDIAVGVSRIPKANKNIMKYERPTGGAPPTRDTDDRPCFNVSSTPFSINQVAIDATGNKYNPSVNMTISRVPVGPTACGTSSIKPESKMASSRYRIGNGKFGNNDLNS
jgi:hypothetical protein